MNDASTAGRRHATRRPATLLLSIWSSGAYRVKARVPPKYGHSLDPPLWAAAPAGTRPTMASAASVTHRAVFPFASFRATRPTMAGVTARSSRQLPLVVIEAP